MLRSRLLAALAARTEDVASLLGRLPWAATTPGRRAELWRVIEGVNARGNPSPSTMARRPEVCAALGLPADALDPAATWTLEIRTKTGRARLTL